LKHWDDIKKQVYEAEEPLSENAWAGMEQMLDADKPKLRRGGWWYAVAAVALVGLVLGVITFTGDGVERGVPKSATDTSVVSPEQEAAPGNEASTTIAHEEEPSSAGVSTSRESEAIPATSAKATPEQNSPAETVSPAQGITVQEDASVSGTIATTATQTSVTSNNQPKEEHPVNAVQTEPKPALPAKPIGLPHQSWSSPSPKIFSVGNPIFSLSGDAEEVGENSYKYRWELRAFAMTTYNLAPGSYDTQTPTTHVDYAKATNNAVTPGFGFDAGLEVKYRVFKHFKIGGGIEYRRLTNTVNFDYESNKIPLIDSASGHIIDYFESPNTRQYSYSGTNSYTFVSIPISLYYETPLRGKWSLGFEGIYNHSFLVKQSSIGVNPTQLDLEQQGDGAYQSALSAAQFRVSLMYQLNDHLYLAAEPAYRQYLGSFTKGSNVNWTPRDLSLSISMLYRFNLK
jgi:cytoskeletal protein RodZ